ncbi:MAG: hypothetical protein JXR84_12735 [Anaerolineae bacterium]|nr:hypothetical protein [Anaerolineae bacterium]
MRKIGCWSVSALLVWLWVLVLATPQAVSADGTVIYVDQDAPGPTHDGTSWTTAYSTLQDALDYTNVYSTTAYEIWIAEGVYYPDEGGSHVSNAVTETFRIPWNNVELYGGFVATETMRTQRDWTAHPTILSGDIDSNDTNTDGNFIAETWNDIQGDNAYHVLYLGGVYGHSITETTVIDGFIVTGGYANGISPLHEEDKVGGGYYSAILTTSNVVCSPMLTNLIFSGNRASQSGGGMYNFANDGDSSPTLTNVTFSGNYADFGGGMYNGGIDFGRGNPTLTNVTFSGNQAYRGGGMSNGGSGRGFANPVLLNVTFIDNSAGSYGGGMYNIGYESDTYHGVSSPMLTNVIFSGNQAANGAGMFNWGNNGTSSPALTNVTFSDNSATNIGGGIYNYVDGVEGVSSPTLVNCILWDNTAATGPQVYNSGTATLTVTYSDVEWPSGTYTGTGNLNVAPQFVEPVTGNYRLQANSPAIDAGDPNRLACPAVDLDGALRDDLRCDIGAFERVYSNGDTVIKTDFIGGVPYSFGPTWVSMTLSAVDSGTVTVTKHIAYPGGTYQIGEVAVTWWITSDLSAGWPITLGLCYTDAEITGLTETGLRAFRWDGMQWTTPISTGLTVNADANCVILTGITEFSAWTLKDISTGAATPTALTVKTLKIAKTYGSLGVVVVLSLLGVVELTRKRRR